jgi:hypothetical protein
VKELKMLTILQKEYSLDINDFAKWQEMLLFRNTIFGKVQYYIGKCVALIFIGRLVLSVKQVL